MINLAYVISSRIYRMKNTGDLYIRRFLSVCHIAVMVIIIDCQPEDHCITAKIPLCQLFILQQAFQGIQSIFYIKSGITAMMEVGAMMVGKITNLKPGACEVKKGEEKGYFEFGGSTIVLLLQHGKVRMDSDLIENSENGYETIVRMGERIGKCKLPKRA